MISGELKILVNLLPSNNNQTYLFNPNNNKKIYIILIITKLHLEYVENLIKVWEDQEEEEVPIMIIDDTSKKKIYNVNNINFLMFINFIIQ